MYLNASTDKIEIVLGGTVATNQLQWNVSYQDITSSGMTLPQSGGAGLTNNATAVDIVAAPAASTTRQVTQINVYNADTATATVTIQKDVSGTNYVLIQYALTTLDTLMWSREDGWRLMSAASGGAITLLGDVTGTGIGSVTTTIANDAVTTVKILNDAVTTSKILNDAVTTSKILNDNVTYAKIQNVSAASKLLGRGSAGGAGDVEEITLGTGLTMTGTTLDATGGGGGISAIGTIDSQTKSANGAVISGTDLVMQTADATNPGLVTTGTQTFAGAKTFSAAPTFSTMTAGSVLFAGASGLLSQDNANLFWDDANNRLGIGTASPLGPLHIEANITATTNGFIITRTGVTSTNASFQIANGTNIAGEFLPIFLFTSNFTTGGTGVTTGGFFSSRITNNSSNDIGIVIESRTKTASALTQGSILAVRSFATDYLQVRHNGNLILQNGGTFTDAGFRLDVNGTTRLQGDVTISDTRNIILATGTGTKIGTATTQKLAFFNSTPIVQPANTIAINDVLVNLGLRASGGVSNFTTNIDISTKDIVTDGTTGTKIGTATSQKLSLWNAAPDIQPTTAITAAAFVANTSGIIDDSATFGGYTMGQVVAALKRIGALA